MLPEEPLMKEAKPNLLLEEPVVEVSKSAEVLPDEAKAEISKPGVIAESSDSPPIEQFEQNNIEDDFGIRAEALYDYQAGNIPTKFKLEIRFDIIFFSY